MCVVWEVSSSTPPILNLHLKKNVSVVFFYNMKFDFDFDKFSTAIKLLVHQLGEIAQFQALNFFNL